MHPTLATFVAEHVLDARLAALLWLLVEGGVPAVAIGSAPSERRATLLGALLSVIPERPWVVLDADAEPLTMSRLAAVLRGGPGLGVVLSASDLRMGLERLSAPAGDLPSDAARRLGTVLVIDETPRGTRCSAAHYLRPTERDGQGHLQRRPPAVLAAWDQSADVYEDYAWAITPELADRVDRSQADLEERLKDRAGFLSAMARDSGLAADVWTAVVTRYLATEPKRTPAPPRPPTQASPSPGRRGDAHHH